MSALVTELAHWLLDFAALATVLLATVLAARRLLRSEAHRMALAWSTWLALAGLAIVTAMPEWPRIPVLASGGTRIAERVDESVWLLSEVSPPAEPLSTEVDPPFETASGRFRAFGPLDWQSTIVLAWLATAGLACLWIGLGIVQTWRLLWHCTRAPEWIAAELAKLVGKRRRGPGLRISSQLASAAAVGAIRPRILLPHTVQGESCAATVRAALAHEWAHIRHGDLWLLAIERLLLVLLAWHPLFWWLRREVRMDQELLADAAAAGEEPVKYAEALVEWAKTTSKPPLGLAALSLWESPHTLSRRVTMLLDPKRSKTPAGGGAMKLAVFVGALVLAGGLSVATLRPLSADDEPKKPAAEAATTKSAGENVIKVFAVQRGDATARAEMLRALLGQGGSVTQPLRISADQRTNSIVVTGNIQDLELIRGILGRLDSGPSETRELPSARAVAMPPRAAQQILLKCVVVEVPQGELAGVLPEVDLQPQPSPELAVVVEGEAKWQSVLEKIEGLKGSQIISRPQMVTLSGQSATVQMHAPVQNREQVEVAVGMTIQLTPELLGWVGPNQKLRLAVEAKQTGLAAVHEKTPQGEREIEEQVVLREFRTQVTAPVGKVAIVVDRNRRQDNALILAIEWQLVQAGQSPAKTRVQETRASEAEQFQSIQKQLIELAARQAQQQEADAKHRQELLHLRQEIDQLLGQASQSKTQSSRSSAYPAKAQAANSAVAREQELARRNLEQAQEAAARAKAADAAERQTRIRLMELDRSDAELNLEAARVELANLEVAHQKSLISSSQLALAKLAVRRAELQIEKINVQLEGVKREAALPRSR